MQIKSLTLLRPDEQPQERHGINGKKALMQALDEMLGDVAVDLGADEGQGVTLPLLIADARVSHCRIYLSYHVIDQESGLLAVSHEDSAGKTRSKDLGVVVRSDLDCHLQQLLTLGKVAYIELHFSPSTAIATFSKGVGIIVMLGALLGIFSLFYFSDVIWHDRIIANAWKVAAVVYVISGLLLLPQILSEESRKRAASMGQTRIKQACGLLFGNVILTFGLMCGGINVLHLYGSHQDQVDIVFSDKARDYYGKHCKGSVSFEQFSGSICLENRAYWTVIQPGMQAQAQGELSAVGFEIKAIALTGK